MRSGLWIAAALLLAGCSKGTDNSDALVVASEEPSLRMPETVIPAPRVVVPGENVDYRLIFSDEDGKRLGPPYWNPSSQQIAEAEARLADALHTARNDDAHDIPEKLERYGRQYFGITRAGRQLLVVNAFCDHIKGSDLTARVEQVFDGGDCYFQALYDISTGRFVSVMVNSVA